MQQRVRVTKQNKNKSRLNYAQYKRRRHVSDMPLLTPWGFPWLPPGLTYWLCGLLTEESWLSSIFVLFFLYLKKKAFDPPFRVRITYSSVGPDEVGGGNSWQQERKKEEEQEEGATVFLCVVLILGVQNSVFECYIAQF